MQIKKRDGRLVQFSEEKIVNAITKAMNETNAGLDLGLALRIAKKIKSELNDQTDVETIQDMVEEKLMCSNRKDVAKRYILYREQHNQLRNKPWQLNELQEAIFKGKYENNEEGMNAFFDRISGGNEKIKKLMIEKKFLPAGRIMANRGLHNEGKKITYSNCYVLKPPEDNLEDIFDTAKKLARTYSYGGGVGLDISKLRPRNSVVNNAAKYTTGAVSFMDLYSMTTGLIGQNNRRGALMLSLDCNHPDIEEFIDIKNDLNKVTKANISVKVTDDFMMAVFDNDMFDLEFKVEATGEVIKKTVNARDVFNKLAKSNWNCAEPGMLYWDRIKNWNILSEDKNFEFSGVNPCAEEPLPSGGSCLLGSINLSEFVIKPFTEESSFDYSSFNQTVKDCVVYLNEILDEGLPLHPLQEQRESVRDWRQIGLGIFGISDMLIKMGIKYGNEYSLYICDKIGFEMINSALQQSAILAKEKGAYPKYDEKAVLSSEFIKHNAYDETLRLIQEYGLHNSQLLTIAPTGSLSTMIGVSGGIEPIYNISYTRKTESLHDEETYYKVYTPIVKEYMEFHKLESEEQLPDFFVTAMTLDYRDRILMQSVWQMHIDASISSTVNVPNEFTVEQVEKLYKLAYRKGLKGITIFRDGCARSGILINNEPPKTNKQQNEVHQSGDCPECGGVMIQTGGCKECLDCGYSPCGV